MYKTAKQIIKEAKTKATKDYNKKLKADNLIYQKFSGLEKLTKEVRNGHMESNRPAD